MDDYHHIMESHSINGLSSLMKQGNIEIRSYDNASVGMDFRHLEKNDNALFEEACHHKAIVIGLGEINVFFIKEC